MMKSMATRDTEPYYKGNKTDQMTGLVVISFTVGVLLGATIALGWAGI